MINYANDPSRQSVNCGLIWDPPTPPLVKVYRCSAGSRPVRVGEYVYDGTNGTNVNVKSAIASSADFRAHLDHLAIDEEAEFYFSVSGSNTHHFVLIITERTAAHSYYCIIR